MCIRDRFMGHGHDSRLAADAVVLPTKAPVLVRDVWWMHGYFEVGGRGFPEQS